MIRKRVTYEGRVQGVGFRATSRSLAKRFAVSGWVRNLADGTVQLEVQGEAPEVDAALAAIRDRMAGFIRAERAEPAAIAEGEQGFAIVR